MCSTIFDEVSGFLLRDTLDVRHFVPELDAVELVGVFQQLGAERRRDELRGRRQLVDHVGYRLTMLSV